MKRILSSSLLTIILSCFCGGSFAVSTRLLNNISKKSASNVQVIEEYGNYRFVFWETNSISRVETSQFFLQRVNQNGEFLWKSAILISTIGKYQNSHKFSSDSLGGVYITWEERDSISNNIDVLAQRIDSTGNKLWGSDGKKLALFKSSKISPYVISNGASGAIFVWSDSRNDLTENNWDIFAQNLDSSGNSLWSESGIVVSADLKDEFIGKLVKAQNGGIAIVYNKVIQSADKLSSGYEFCFKTINESGQVIQASNFLTLPPSDEHYKLAGDIISKTSDSFIIALTSTNYKNNIPNITSTIPVVKVPTLRPLIICITLFFLTCNKFCTYCNYCNTNDYLRCHSSYIIDSVIHTTR